MNTPFPSGFSNRMWLGSLALGLTIAACGGQTDVAVSQGPSTLEPVVVEQVEEPTATMSSTTTTDPTTTTLQAIEPAPSGGGQFEALPSALPEIALAGVGEPIGYQPNAISLPTLGIEQAPIIPVGLEPNGELEVPGADSVGWYEFGVGVDGGQGSTVLAAHIAYNGQDGVFRNLVDMEPGQRFSIERDGQEIEYIVESVTDYDKWELPINDLFSEEGDERLVLITCGGSFNTSLRSYEDNTVVVATPA